MQVFEANHIKIFMGGILKIPSEIKTNAQLITILESWIRELRGWGENEIIADISTNKEGISITLEKGIHQ